MSQTHRQYVAREAVLCTVINTTISIAFAVFLSRGKDVLPLWGTGGRAVDFVPQTFFLCFATTLAVTLSGRKRRRQGTVPPMSIAEAGWLARTPRQLFVRALLVGAAATLVFAPLGVAALYAFGITSLAAHDFILMKALFGVVLTVLVVPSIARAALAERSAPAG